MPGKSQKQKALTVQKIINSVLGSAAAGLPDGPSFVPEQNRKKEYFYPGNDDFVSAPAEGAKWELGYAYADLTPRDYDRRDYYLGGYLTVENGFNNKVVNAIDEMRCRVIALDDNSGRGISVFATLDCIGLGNTDIRKIRRHFADLIRIGNPGVKINTVNVFSTHTHSCVDTQGLWTATFKKSVRNIRKAKSGKGTYLTGTDSFYMNFLTKTIAGAMQRAVNDMTPGRLYFARRDIGDGYFVNKNRRSATALITDMLRLRFVPDDSEKRPTMIVSVGAHPDVAGLPTTDGSSSGREICGEYIYYMDKLLSEAGYNCMFFNGAICAIYMARGLTNDGVNMTRRYEQSVRYGRELARLALSMTMTREEIEKDSLLYDKDEIAREKRESEANNCAYTLWCDGISPVTEEEVSPFLNIALSELKIGVTNPLIKLVGKLNLASYTVLSGKNGEYSVISEIGYLTFGDSLRVVTAPGEFCCDLLAGGESLTAMGSFNSLSFGLPYLRQLFDDDSLYCFGLGNDALGYIVPDNDWILGEFSQHYHELISLGENTGSTVIRGFIDLKKRIEENK